MSAAAKIPLRALPEELRETDPTKFELVQGDGRAIAVAKLRELADKIEACELDGAHVAWRDHAFRSVDRAIGTNLSEGENLTTEFRVVRERHCIPSEVDPSGVGRDGFSTMVVTTIEEV